MQKRKNDVKARTTLLLALPDEHQLRFSKYKTAQDLWAAILKTFGRNEATKKTKKNQLKQQYGNFKAEGTETQEQTFNRLQAIVSHLEFMDVEIEQDDLNQKFLTSLAPEWLMYTIVWRNRSDLDTMSLDELYNHLKVYEPEAQKKSELNSQNMDFISSAKNNSGKEEVNTASFPTASTQVSPTSANVAAASISHDTIDEDDIEEMDIKWNMALLRRDWNYMANEEENHALVADEEAPKEFALMAKSSSKNKVFDNSLCSKSCKKNTDSLNTKIIDLSEKLSDRYSAVPPPAQVYSPPKKDMSWTGLHEFTDDTITNYSRPSPSIESNSTDLQSSNSFVFKNGESSSSILSKPVITFVKAADRPTGNSQNILDNKGYWDSGFSRHMTGNISYLSDYEPYNGGYVSFGQGGGNITGKECIVLGRDFKLKDDTNVLLRTPRQHNMYSIDLNNIFPHKDLTCLGAKASTDESMLWHRRLEEVLDEDLKEMMQLVPVEEVYVEALQTLVKETLSIRQATSDKEKELWVELKRLFEPDFEDQLWTHTQALMHDLVKWKLYDSCGVHHVLTGDQEIFMLVERDYPLRKRLAIVMISNKL
nr:ribonuclease H-like domain-containing protein [Tanacetum cinerariifolium]